MRITRLSLAMAIGFTLAIPAAVEAASKKYKAMEVSGGGSVSGKVMFDGTVPADAVENILITKDQNVCGSGEREVIWIDVKEGALRGAFVFIDKIKEGKEWQKPAGEMYVIDQKGCRFRPWAQVVRPGPITIRNSDKGVLHNINMREMIGVEKGRVARRGVFNFGQPDPGDIQQELKTRRSPYISINCEAHNFMFGFLMAPNHPYAVVVGEDGSYKIDNIPPGEYNLKAWHPRIGVIKSKITVPEGGNVESDFKFKVKG